MEGEPASKGAAHVTGVLGGINTPLLLFSSFFPSGLKLDGKSDRTKRRRRERRRDDIAQVIGCDPDDLEIEFDEAGDITFLRYDARAPTEPLQTVDEWVYKRRCAFLSQSQLEEVKPPGLSRRQISRRAAELSFLIPVLPLAAPLQVVVLL